MFPPRNYIMHRIPESAYLGGRTTEPVNGKTGLLGRVLRLPMKSAVKLVFSAGIARTDSYLNDSGKRRKFPDRPVEFLPFRLDPPYGSQLSSCLNDPEQ